MAVVAVPRALREKLGDDASDSLVDLLQQFEAEQTDHLIEMVEERFVRRVVESENRLRNELREEMHAGFMGLQKQIGDVRAEIGSVRTELNKEIGSVRTELGKEIAEVRKEITVQTRWILAVLVAAAVLVPIIQRVMEALLP